MAGHCPYTEADPGFSERGLGQTSAYIIYLWLFNKSFFYGRTYGQNICVCFSLGVRLNHPWIRPRMYDLQNPVNSQAPFRVLVAQSVEHPPGVRKVMGSNPIGDSDFFLSLFMYVSTVPLNIINPHTATTAIQGTNCSIKSCSFFVRNPHDTNEWWTNTYSMFCYEGFRNGF